jgi:hypothetical protein
MYLIDKKTGTETDINIIFNFCQITRTCDIEGEKVKKCAGDLDLKKNDEALKSGPNITKEDL